MAAARKAAQCYRFLVEKEKAGVVFTVIEISAATGWKANTIKTYLNKKWKPFFHKTEGGYRVEGITAYTEDEYVRLMSQKDEVSADPRRPQLRPEVESLVRKARESALLGLQLYNNPSTVFRTEGFIVLNVIAWTALLHAIFEQRGESYFYRDHLGQPTILDGEKKAWDLGTCIDAFWPAGANVAVKSNLEFLIKLRNRIEHRYAPAIDAHVAGECQASLLNFDQMLVQSFGSYFAIRESLAVPLQTSSIRTTSQTEALRKFQAKQFDELKQFVDAYRGALSPDIYQDLAFTFRVYLVPKTGNHSSSSDIAYEFVKYDPTKPEEMAKLEKQITLIKERQVPVANANLFKAKDVVREVVQRTTRRFTLHTHQLAWAKYRVRVSGFDPGACNTTYCIADNVHRDYAYTQAWIDLLVAKLRSDDEFNTLVAYQPASAKKTR